MLFIDFRLYREALELIAHKSDSKTLTINRYMSGIYSPLLMDNDIGKPENTFTHYLWVHQIYQTTLLLLE